MNNIALFSSKNETDERMEVTLAEKEEEQTFTIHAAMAMLPDELTVEYREACKFVPEIVEHESDPRWFLSFHPSDPLAAARRLANYWKKRKEIFKERAFLPINLSSNGALTTEDVRILKTGAGVYIPRDTKGRTVMYTDASKKRPDMKPSLRLVFFFGQCFMENEICRKEGFVFIRNISNPFAADVIPDHQALIKDLLASCMPVRPHRVHLLCISPPGMNNIIPLFINTVFSRSLNFLSFTYGKSLTAHVVSSKQECLSKLMEYDFVPEGLPVGLGGSWTGGFEPWRRGHDSEEPDALTLEIETDLTCLFRNALWCHEQVAAAADHPNIQTEAVAASNVTTTTTTNEPTHEVAADKDRTTSDVAKQNEVSESCTDYDRKPAARKRHKGDILKSGEKTAGAVTTGISRENGKQQHVASAVTTQPSNSDEEQQQQRQQHLTLEELEEDKRLHPWRYETEEQKIKRRERDIGYAKKKRAKEKIVIQVLQSEHDNLATANKSLKEEGERLERLLHAAEHEIASFCGAMTDIE